MFGTIEDTRVTFVEKGVDANRKDFLKKLLEHNGFEVLVEEEKKKKKKMVKERRKMRRKTALPPKKRRLWATGKMGSRYTRMELEKKRNKLSSKIIVNSQRLSLIEKDSGRKSLALTLIQNLTVP